MVLETAPSPTASSSARRSVVVPLGSRRSSPRSAVTCDAAREYESSACAQRLARAPVDRGRTSRRPRRGSSVETTAALDSPVTELQLARPRSRRFGSAPVHRSTASQPFNAAGRAVVPRVLRRIRRQRALVAGRWPRDGAGRSSPRRRRGGLRLHVGGHGRRGAAGRAGRACRRASRGSIGSTTRRRDDGWSTR